jgi:thiol-disulfide isomerase/thioredoxin
LLPAISQPVNVTGEAPGAEGKTIKFLTWGDQITYLETEAARTKIDSTGHFSISFGLPYTSYVAVAIDLHRSNLYMQPGRSYFMKIAPMDYDKELEVNPFILSQNLGIELINPGDNELNVWIRDYDAKYDQFLLDHFNALYLERKKNLLDTFRLQVNEWFTGVEQPYLEAYIRYKTAGLEQVSHALTQYELAKKYFISQPVLYDNVEYMHFFNTYFTKYLTSISPVIRKIDLMPVIKGAQPYKNLMKTLAADTILKEENLRELVMLKGLYELFYSDKETQDHVIGIVNAIKSESKYEGNRTIATDMYAKMTKLRPGTKAPGFTLVNMKKEKVSLGDFIGKPVVINFWTTYCLGCISEMEKLVPIYEKYKNKVEFISISADKFWFKTYFFVERKPQFRWQMLHFGEDTDLLVNYDVRTYPLFVIVDKSGNIYQYPAVQPGEGLEEVLDEITRQ